MKFSVTTSCDADLCALPFIESQAAKLFSGHPLTAALRLEESAPRDFAEPHARGMLWVARDETGMPVAFAFVEAGESGWHLEEMDVLPEFSRRGIGAELLRVVIENARARGATQLTLTTFRDIPWNAPYYARLGFAIIEDAELPGDLRERVAREERAGLPRALRVAMRYTLAVTS
jgi:GNAT superfamily N-acetyltransferase